MNAIKAIYRNGQIVPHQPVNWPEGIELVVEPASTFGFPDEDRPADPFDMTAEEEAQWQAFVA